MNLEQLIGQFRIDVDDTVTNLPLWADEWIAAWFTEAQAEAATASACCTKHPTLPCARSPWQPTRPPTTCTSRCLSVHLRFQATGAATSSVLSIKAREELDRIRPGWRDETGTPRYAVQDDTRASRWCHVLKWPQTLHVEGYRLPLKALENDTDKPEIHEAHHRHLVHWALHRAFSKLDSEKPSTQRARQRQKPHSRATSATALTPTCAAPPGTTKCRRTRRSGPEQSPYSS